jgi:dihydroorotate dehydrogenase
MSVFKDGCPRLHFELLSRKIKRKEQMMNIDLSTLRIMNAAGNCKRFEDVLDLARTPVTDITVGVMVVDEGRPGNSGNTFWVEPSGHFALNSRGLPTPPTSYYRDNIEAMAAIASGAGKRLRANISGFSPQDYVRAAEICVPSVDEIELNFGCPNIVVGSGRKPIMAFDIALMRNIIFQINATTSVSGRPDVKVSVKVSPYSNPLELEAVAAMLGSTPIDAVITTNTFPNSMMYGSDGQPIISVGLAGASGKGMLPIALGQVAQFRKLLHPKIEIIGVGGITCPTLSRTA